jgi:UDP-N-acetylmuramoyl-L-alanyl-D-glutamate--2,6-diaminopimelate ligase
MNFDELIKLVSSNKTPAVRVDSRLVKDGDVFVAVKGTTYDGSDFIAQAIANGAKYIVCRRDTAVPNDKCEFVLVDDPAKAAAILAQTSVGNPASKLTNLAVTGTNGKTTVAYLVRSCIQNAGQKCGLISTIVYDTGQTIFDANLTTPDCLTIAEQQSQMLKAGVKYMITEASSHALSQNRLAGIDFKAAAFTNLTGDHLDYHKTEKDYLVAKAKLFQALSPDAAAVLNKQSPHAAQIAKKTKAKILWFAIDEPADIVAHIESMNINGTAFTLKTAAQEYQVKTPLLGRYNVSNHLAAAGLCFAVGLDLHQIATGLSGLRTIPGRLEKLDSKHTSIIIDYAHSDDALKNVLSTLKPLCKGKLIILFGCGGDRDRTKRPRMARVAEKLADYIVVTSDNPRTEKPTAIIEEILAGFKNPNSPNIAIEQDRKKAIELALKNAAKDDIVLIAGKGHETYQIIGNQKLEFSDKKIALECLAKIK